VPKKQMKKEKQINNGYPVNDEDNQQALLWFGVLSLLFAAGGLFGYWISSIGSWLQ